MKNKIAVVTGAVGHLGQEICKSLAKKGVLIVAVDKNKNIGDEFVQSLKKEFPQKHCFVSVDLEKEEDIQKLVATVKKLFISVDYLVNNAAFYDDIKGWGVPFEEEGYNAWERVLKVNLLAPFFLTQKISPLMKKSSSPAIVNIGSIYGVVGPDHNLYCDTEMTNPAAYSASKGGLLQTTKWLSTVLAPHIRVNMVSPGGIERGQLKVFQDRYCKKTPLQRMAHEDDVSDVVRFLLSSEAKYITGQNIIVDGGWTVW